MRASGEHWFMYDVGNIYSMRFHYAGIWFYVLTITIYFINPSGKLKLSFDRTTKITGYTYSVRFHYAGVWFYVRYWLYIQYEVHAVCQH